MKRTCENCKYFRLHYVRWTNGRYVPTRDGHCVKPRLKIRKADTLGCVYWREVENRKT